jgi:hypothetical protein
MYVLENQDPEPAPGRLARAPRGALAALAALACVVGSVSDARAATFSGTLYFTTFSGGTNVNDMTYSYDDVAKKLTLGSVKGLAAVGGADGLIFAPDGKTLLVGGQGAAIYQVDSTTGKVGTTLPTGGLPVYHLALDPSLGSVYGGGSEAGAAGVSVTTLPSGPAVTKSISGSDSVITGIAFDGKGNGYYTSSGAGGTGNFGTITNPGSTSPKTTALITGLPAAHGIIYDPFTGDLILVGATEVAQYDPTMGKIVSFAFFSGTFDQGSVDGLGHLFAASNDGTMLFLDYSKSGLVGSSTFSTQPFVIGSMDDVAPLVGLGGGGQGTPEPASLTLLGLGATGLMGYAWRRRRTAVVA